MRPDPPQIAPTKAQVSPLLTIDEVAAWLQVSVKTIYQWRARRPDPYGPAAIKVGKYLRWKREVVQAWIDEREADAPGAPIAR